ncbi:hypothetical protein D910_08095 [Dendroctonus ponderosae]
MFWPGIFSIFLFLLVCVELGWAFELKLQCDDPIVLGATVQCTVSVYDESGQPLTGETFKYTWKDDAIPQNNREIQKVSTTDDWSVTYNRSVYTSDSLNGQLVVAQRNETRAGFVSVTDTVRFNTVLKAADKNYVSTAPTVLSYWFLDCVYYGITTDMQFEFNFTKTDEHHIIETLIMGDFSPLPPPVTLPPSTTSTPPTTTTKGSTTTAGTTTTSTTTLKPKSVSKRDVASGTIELNFTTTAGNKTESNIKMWQNGTLVPYNALFPYVCNSTAVVTDQTKVHGFFQSSFITKAPISNVTVSGNNWLQHGELLSLNIKCQGSEKIQFCYFFKPGLYNVTGNETCEHFIELETCEFPIRRYLQDKYTVIIIIKNDVSKKITPVAVTVYKVKQQSQLSVIVVPVAFSLAAVVSIVFGIAYYLQNRSRFVVEVADFDFGAKYADMEYKTFKDRLKDSIVNAFTRDPMPTTSDAPIWPPSHKYGSMT